ncbi:Uncharacterised protein [Salmonella enterica subsp. arizonae]|nr:Uncharacterised protein [Salmonella enterica subsp. arizonae]
MNPAPTSVVAPVVVNPENDSKKASVMVRLGLSEKINGSAPTLPSTVQNSTTIRNPSRDFSSPFSLRFGHHSMEPIASATKKVCVNALPAPSRYISATSPGRIIVPENKITSSPTIRVMARKCISAASFILNNEVGIILQSLTIAMNHG